MKMTKEKLVEFLTNYFGLNNSEGSYTYELTRVKSAFVVDTMSFEDFEEFEEKHIEDLANHIWDGFYKNTEIKKTVENYKQVRRKEKQEKTDKLLATAKAEVRRLEKGIDKVLYHIDTEDLSDPAVWNELQKDLINLYNGKEI